VSPSSSAPSKPYRGKLAGDLRDEGRLPLTIREELVALTKALASDGEHLGGVAADRDEAHTDRLKLLEPRAEGEALPVAIGTRPIRKKG
jgi:hypothetical protein